MCVAVAVFFVCSTPVALEVVPGHAVHVGRRVEIFHHERTVRQEPNLAFDAVEPETKKGNGATILSDESLIFLPLPRPVLHTFAVDLRH